MWGVGAGRDKRLHTADDHVNWGSHYGRWCGRKRLENVKVEVQFDSSIVLRYIPEGLSVLRQNTPEILVQPCLLWHYS